MNVKWVRERLSDDEMNGYLCQSDGYKQCMCQDVGPAAFKYDMERIGEIQHEARSHRSVPSGPVVPCPNCV